MMIYVYLCSFLQGVDLGDFPIGETPRLVFLQTELENLPDPPSLTL